MCNGNVQSVGLWNERDRKKNSTFRELKAILIALQSFCSHLRNEKVIFFSLTARMQFALYMSELL